MTTTAQLQPTLRDTISPLRIKSRLAVLLGEIQGIGKCLQHPQFLVPNHPDTIKRVTEYGQRIVELEKEVFELIQKL